MLQLWSAQGLNFIRVHIQSVNTSRISESLEFEEPFEIFMASWAGRNSSISWHFDVLDEFGWCFKIVNFDAFKFDEIDPIIIDDLHAVLMKVEWNDYPTQAPAKGLGEIRQAQFLNLTPSEESTLSTFFSKVMRPNLISKYQDDDGKQVIVAQYLPAEYNLYTTPYLKIYQPVNTEFPSWLEKALAKLFDEAKV